MISKLKKLLLAKFPKIFHLIRRLNFEIWSRKPSFSEGFNFKKSDLFKILWVNPSEIENVGIGWGFYKKNKQFNSIINKYKL